MPITMRCPGCKTQFDFATDLEGKRIKCKTCGDVFRVESPAKKTVLEDDRPAVGGSTRRRDEDDRLPSRTRRPIEEDEDRPSARYRRPSIDDQPRPASGRYRRPADEDDEPPRRFRADDDTPRKKRIHPLLIIGPLAALAIAAVVVVLIVATRDKKTKSTLEGGDLVKAPAKSCPLEIPEKDVGTLVLPDSGNTFGILRKADTIKKAWTCELYDMGAGRRVGRIDLTDMEEPRSASLSPDGKYLLVVEGAGSGISDPTISIWSVAENKPLTARKWNPYPHRGGADPPQLYRAEFIGNDKVLTISTARIMDVWPLPTFDPPVVVGVYVEAKGDRLGRDDRSGQNTLNKYQRQIAFTADHKLMAVWNGNGFAFVNTLDGVALDNPTPPVSLLVKEQWPRERFLDRVNGGPVAFSPDGKFLAGILTHDVGQKKHLLCLWDVSDQKPPVVYDVAGNQFNDAPSIHWWGSRYIVTHGTRIEGMLIDTRTGLAKRQLMGPIQNHYGFGRDGRVWYASSEERTQPAKMYVVDAPEPDLLVEPDDYEQIVALNEEFFLRRLWLEPTGVLRKPTRFDPPLQQRLIRRP